MSFGYGIAALLLAPRGSERVFLKRRPARCSLAGVQNAGRGGRLPSSNIIASNAAQARMKKPRPTNDRGSACQTIWCRHAPGMAGSMAPFSAKRKGRQSFAPQFVYPPNMQVKQMRGKLLSISRASCHRLPSVGKCSSAAQGRAYTNTGPPLDDLRGIKHWLTALGSS